MSDRLDGRALRVMRVLQGRTQQDLASAVGVTDDAVSLWELGKRRISPAMTLRLVRALAGPTEPRDPGAA